MTSFKPSDSYPIIENPTEEFDSRIGIRHPSTHDFGNFRSHSFNNEYGATFGKVHDGNAITHRMRKDELLLYTDPALESYNCHLCLVCM